MSFRLFALVTCSYLLLAATPISALRFYVDQVNGDNRRSVQAAQDSSTAFKTLTHALRIAHLVSEGRPHVIEITSGTYSPSSGEQFPLEITQTGIYIETTGLTIFDGENKTNFFKVTAPTSDFVLKGIDFINGSAEQGGVAYCQTCSLRVVDSRFFNNKATKNGHVIYTENGRLKFYNNLVRDSGSGNDTLAVLELRNSATDSLVRDEIRNNTFYRNPSPNIWASGARTYISSNIFIDPAQTAIRDADSTAAPLIDHNLFWETETLYVSDKGDSVNIVKATRDTLNFASAGITVPSFMTNVPDVQTLRFRGDTLSLAQLNTRIPSFVTNNPDTLFRYQVGVGYQYQIEVDGLADQYGFKALTLPKGAVLDNVSNIPRLILWNPTLNDTISHSISIEITPPSGAVDTLSYQLDVFSNQSFPDTTGFLAVVDSTGRFTGMVKETSTIEVPHTAGETYSFTIGVAGNRPQYFFNPQTLPNGVSSTKVSDEGVIEWATTLADTGSGEINIEIINPAGDDETLSYKVFVFAPEAFPDTSQTTQVITTTLSPDTTSAVTAINALTPSFSAAASAVDNLYANPSVLDSTVNRFELVTGSPAIDKGTPIASLVDAVGKSRNDIGNQGGPNNGGAPSHGSTFSEIKITTLPDTVITEGQTFTYNPTLDPSATIDLVDLIPGSGAPTMGTFTTFGKVPPITWTPTIVDTGSHLIGVTVITSNSSGRHYFPLRVKPSNEIPVVNSTPNTTALEDQAYSYAIQATDANGDTLSYSLDSGPSGLSVNAATGLVAWTPTQGQIGSDSVAVRISDGKGGLNIHRYVLTVLNTNDPPTISSTPDTTATEDSPFSYALVASDPDPADTLAYSLGTGPAGASLDSTGAFTWTPTQDQIGSQQISLVVTDKNGGSTTQSFAVAVAAFDDLPVIGGTPDTTALEDQAYTFLLNASDEEGGALSYALTDAPAAMILDSTGTLSWTPGQADIGSHAVSVQVADPAGQLATLSYQLAVQAVNDPPVLRSQTPADSLVRTTGGTALAFAVSASDEEADSLRYSWLVGDALQTAADSIFSHVPSTSARDTVTARVSDGTNNTSFTWVIDGRQIPRLAIDTGTVDFGNVAIGDTARVQLAVSNGGETALNISSLQVDDLRFAAVFAAITVEPGASTTMALSYAPTGRGASADSIRFATDDPDNPAIAIPVAGKGVIATVLSLDLDPTAGDQALATSTIDAGSIFAVNLYAQKTLDLLSYDLRLLFDPTALNYIDFAAQTDGETNLLAATGSPLTATATISADSVVVASVVADSLSAGLSADGLLGVFTFAADSSLSGMDTAIRIERVLLKSTVSDTAGVDLAITISGRPALPGDFNGDGIVGLDDFFLFSDNFGLKQGDETYDPLFDLSENAIVDLDDFFLFGDNFGLSAGKPVVGAQAPGPQALHLEKGAETPDLLEIVPYWTGQDPLRGWMLSLEFEPQVLAFRQFRPRAAEAPLPFIVESEPGRLVFAAGLSRGQTGFDGDMGVLVFDRLAPDRSVLRANGAIGYRAGSAATLTPPAPLELSALPQTFALFAAHPNPFNPETVLPFYLPVQSPVRLRVYDLLGRPVRTLVEDALAAGFHGRPWRGLDDQGRAVGSGLYLVEMRAGDWRQIRKVMLLK